MTLQQVKTLMVREDDPQLAIRLELTGLTESEGPESTTYDEKVARERLRDHINRRVPCAPYD
jgi:hypothetical protein